MRSASPQDYVSIGFAAPGAGSQKEPLRRQACWRVRGSQLLNLPFLCPVAVVQPVDHFSHFLPVIQPFACTILHETIQKKTGILS